MRIVFKVTLVIVLAVLTAAPAGSPPASGRGPQSSEVQAGAEQGLTTRPCSISDLPWDRRPPITLQQALGVADAYVLREDIDLSNYYLLLVTPSPYQDRAWMFRWARLEGEGEGYIEINVTWEGEASRVKSK
jgi:hypothetical protein